MHVRRRVESREEGNVWKGLAAGLIGGLVASWTMNQFQVVWGKLTEALEKPSDTHSGNLSERREVSHALEANKEEQDDATVTAAKAVSEGIFGHQLKESEKEMAGAAVHYAFGTAVGGLYGAVCEVSPEVTIGAGLPFGAAFWLVADETAVPLLGLAKGPTEYPVSTHVYAFASHLVYGATAELVRRAVRNAI